MEGRIPNDPDQNYFDFYQFQGLIKRHEFQKAQELLDAADEKVKVLDAKADYFDIEPVVMIALRAMIQEALSKDDKAFAFEPRRPKRDGNLIIAFDGFQIQVYFDAQSNISKIRVNFLDSDRLQYLFRPKAEVVKAPPPVVTKSTPVENLRLVPRSEPKIRNEPTPLKFEGISLPDEVRAEFDRINEKHPGHHQFLEQAALLLSIDPNFLNSRGLGWFFQKVEKRVHLDRQAGTDAAISELASDIDTYQAARDKFTDTIDSMRDDRPAEVNEIPPPPIPEHVDASDVRRIMIEWGWTNGRQTGDHCIFTYPGARRNLVVNATHTDGLAAAAKAKLRMAWRLKWEADHRTPAAK